MFNNLVPKLNCVWCRKLWRMGRLCGNHNWVE